MRIPTTPDLASWLIGRLRMSSELGSFPPPPGSVSLSDNGDGTATLTVSAGAALADNGDGTATLTGPAPTAAVEVGKRRPPDTVNFEGLFVRVVVLGGPMAWTGHLWNPIAVLECWGPSHDDAFDLCAAATRELLALEGTAETGLLHLSEVDLMTACADTPIDGHPVVTTTASLTVELPVRT